MTITAAMFEIDEGGDVDGMIPTQLVQPSQASEVTKKKKSSHLSCRVSELLACYTGRLLKKYFMSLIQKVQFYNENETDQLINNK